MCFLRTGDHPVDQFPVRNPVLFPEIKRQASRYGVDLGNVKLFCRPVKHIVDPHNPFAVKHTENLFAHFLDLRFQIVFDRCGKHPGKAGHSLASTTSEVFVPEVQEFIVVQRHFDRRGGYIIIIAQNTAVEFNRFVQSFFNQYPPVVFKRQFQGFLQFLSIIGPAYADAGSEVCRFYKYRISGIRCNFRNDFFAVSGKFLPRIPFCRKYRKIRFATPTTRFCRRGSKPSRRVSLLSIGTNG